MTPEGVSAVQEAHFAVIIIANIYSEHSVQALTGKMFPSTIVERQEHLTVYYPYHYSSMP